MILTQRDHSRTWIYTLSASALFAIAILFQESGYRGSTQLHTIMEVIATLLALIVGIVALVRYYSKKDNMYLFIGMGFLGTALLDGYHCIVTSTFFHQKFPSPPPSLIPWSWNASRTFLALLIFLSWWAWKREIKLGKAGQIGDRSVQAITIVLTLLSFCFFAFVPLPRAYYPEFFFGRPQEFVPGVFFLGAFIGYSWKGDWKHDAFKFWLLMSLLVSVICQVAVMSRSFVLFDSMFDMAHMLKILSYTFVLIGLLVGIYSLYSQSSSEMQKESERSKAQFELVIEESPLAMLMINENREIVLANSATSNYFGYAREELLGELIEKLLPQRYRENHPQQVAGFFTDGQSRQLDVGRDLLGLHKEGHEFPVEIFINFVQTSQGPAAICSVVDISDRKKDEAEIALQSEKLKKSNRALENINSELEQFAYVASHDLQEPLRKVASCCQMLADDYADKLDEDGREWIKFAVDGAARMRLLVSDLLEYSRVGALNTDCEPICTQEACDAALYNLSDTIESHGVQIICRPLPMVLGIKGLLIQLFQNLIGNSIKYGNAEQTVIEMGAEPDGHQWRFYVKDNGIGIAPEYHERIFQVFQRLHLKDEYSGTGIGLATCKKVVDKLGGRLWVESQAGEGSTFYFTLPGSKSIHTINPEQRSERI